MKHRKKRVHRRRRSHATPHRRRRRVGAISFSANSPLVKFGSIAAGYLLSGKIWEMIDKAFPDVQNDADKQKMFNGVMAAGGLYFSFLYKGRKNTIITALAGLAAGVGAKGLLQDFGVITGFRDLPVVSGFNEVPVIGGGYNVPAQNLNGISGYVMNSGSGNVVGSVPDYASGSGINATDR